MLNFLNAKCVAEGGKISSSDGRGQFAISWLHHGRIVRHCT